MRRSSSGAVRCNVRLFCAGLATLIALATPLRAQIRGANISLRTGLAVPDDKYADNCGDPSMAFSADVQGRGRVFPQLTLAHFSGSGGGDDLCFGVAPNVGTAVGRLDLDGATRVGLGVGARLSSRFVAIEGVVQGGAIRGVRGFRASKADASRHSMPQVGGQATLVLFRYLLVSAGVDWTRLTLDVTPSGGGAVTSTARWLPMTTVQFGFRIPLGH